jgi:hypothetical protein
VCDKYRSIRKFCKYTVRRWLTDQIEKLYIYPEDRECKRPTTSIIFDRFSQLARYVVQGKDAADSHFQDQLSPAQIEILAVLKMSHDDYWQADRLN